MDKCRNSFLVLVQKAICGLGQVLGKEVGVLETQVLIAAVRRRRGQTPPPLHWLPARTRSLASLSPCCAHPWCSPHARHVLQPAQVGLAVCRQRARCRPGPRL